MPLIRAIGRLALAWALLQGGQLALLAEPFPPFDEADQDPSFLHFRDELARLAAAHDLARLIESMHPEIVTSFGGEGGIEEAVEVFRSDPDRWRALSTVLSLGGKFEAPDRFIAPYTFFAPGVDGDPFATAVIFGERVNVRSGPSPTSRVIARLTHETVRLVEDESPEAGGWLKVQLANGAAGYVNSRYVRSPVDERAEFVLVDGRWLLQSLVAGD
jgi:hypothetical protein